MLKFVFQKQKYFSFCDIGNVIKELTGEIYSPPYISQGSLFLDLDTDNFLDESSDEESGNDDDTDKSK